KMILQRTWNKLWILHDEVKDLFRFFIQPNKSKLATSRGEHAEGEAMATQDTGGPGGGDDGEKRSYSKSQLIGLFLGPLLFIVMLLFFNPTDLSAKGIAIAASTIWIA